MIRWTEIESRDTASIEQMGPDYQVNPLVIEDCLHRNQRPKIEDFENHQFLVWFMLAKNQLFELQFVILPDHVILVPHDRPPEGANWKEFLKVTGDAKDAWHVVYQALDKVTDVTWSEARRFHDEIIHFEEKMFEEECDPKSLLRLSRRLDQVEYSLGHLPSLAEQIKNLSKPKDDLRWKLRDLHDHCERINRNINLYRAQIASTVELYWGFQANRSNRQIKKLTVLASVVAPMTLWSSFWGMNFTMMPFSDPLVFSVALAVMGISALGTVWLLVRKGYWAD